MHRPWKKKKGESFADYCLHSTLEKTIKKELSGRPHPSGKEAGREEAVKRIK